MTAIARTLCAAAAAAAGLRCGGSFAEQAAFLAFGLGRTRGASNDSKASDLFKKKHKADKYLKVRSARPTPRRMADPLPIQPGSLPAAAVPPAVRQVREPVVDPPRRAACRFRGAFRRLCHTH